MKFDVFIKIIIYLLIIRAIVSKAKKGKGMKSNKIEKNTSKEFERQDKKQEGRREGNRNIDLKNLREVKDKIQRSILQDKQEGIRKNNGNINIKNHRTEKREDYSSLSPDERMKRRERELENRNKK